MPLAEFAAFLGSLEPHEEFVQNSYKVIAGTYEISSWFNEYDPFPGIEANGFRNYVEMMTLFGDFVIKNHEKGSFFSQKDVFLRVSRLNLKVLGYLLTIRSTTLVDPKDNLSKTTTFSQSFESIAHIFAEMVTLKEELTALHEMDSIWLLQPLQFLTRSFRRATALFYSKSPLVLISKKAVASRYAECICNATYAHPFSTWDVFDWKINTMLFFNILHLFTPCSAKTVFLPTSSGWRISGHDLVPNNSPSVRKVRCRLLTHSKERLSNNGCLVIYCHGGGLISLSPEAHENYLRQWVADLSGVPILAIDYRLKLPYPVAIQDVLDVYLWAVSGSPEVTRVLGFSPERIVLCGDSSGALLVSSLLGPLNDIKKKSRGHLLMPSALVLIYPFLRPSFALTASRCLLLYESVLPVGVPLVLGAMYSGYNPCLEEEKRVSGDDSHRNLDKQVPQKVSLSNSCWFACDPTTFEVRMKHIEDLMTFKYTSINNYNQFEDFKSISLYLVSAQFDPLLDDSVDLARTWKGPVTMDVMKGCPHGFLYFKTLSSTGNQVIARSFKSLKKAIDDVSDGQSYKGA